MTTDAKRKPKGQAVGPGGEKATKKQHGTYGAHTVSKYGAKGETARWGQKKGVRLPKARRPT